MKNKVIFVKAHFRPLYGKPGLLKSVFGSSQAGSSTEIPSGFEKKGQSDCKIDGERLAEDVSNALTKLSSEGFEVLNISNITSGTHAHKAEYSATTDSSAGWGYGYSFTEGMLIVAKKHGI